jgi:transcriptional regulator with XRE-family HTH domain
MRAPDLFATAPLDGAFHESTLLKIFLSSKIYNSSILIYQDIINMCLSKIIQSFLQHQLAINRMSRLTCSKLSGIPYQTISKILNAERSNYEITTLLKIADFFECSIDEVVGREAYTVFKQDGGTFNKLQSTDASSNLKRFISNKIYLLSISPYELGLSIGFSKNTLAKFLKEHSAKHSINAHILISLANYFDISIDVMIGRITN